MITRRILLKNGGIALVGMGTVPSFVLRTVQAVPADTRRKKVLIAVFQRGGADGLNTVVPFGEQAYYASRPTIAIPAPTSGQESAVDLNGFFGLHPSLKPLHRLYQEGQMAIVHAAGSPNSTRSHFDAQDFMESAAPGTKSISDGWLSRYLEHNPNPEATSFRGVAMGTSLPRSLKGETPAIALGNIESFDLRAGPLQRQARTAYETLYDQETNSLLSGTAQEMFQAIDFLKKANPGQYRPEAGVEYPQGRFGRNLGQVAQLIKANIGLEVAFLDIGGWDHHINEGGINGQLSNRLREFGQGLAALYRDLGDRMEDVLVLTMSEFGRTARENGNAGTDHGHANVMFLLGGDVKGGKVYGRWPGLAPEQLYQGRDLALTTDFRDVFAEVLVRHLDCSNADAIFPGYRVDPKRFKGML
jgi:uncharacterized protein (DUF1501 family)